MKIGIIGYGKMGRSIFNLVCETPMHVTVLGRDSTAMRREFERCEKRLRRAGSGVVDGADGSDALSRVQFTTSYHDLRECGLVIETVSEDFETKVEVLRAAEAMIPSETPLVTNTSSLSITSLAQHVQNPTRFCGLHFFHPVRLTTVVEIVTAPHTSRQVVDFLQQVARDIGRTPVVVKDLVGSCVNVPLILYCCEAMYMLEQGIALPSGIDDLVARRIARIGPCETIDAAGVPFCMELLRRTFDALGLDQNVPEVSQRLIRDGRLGRYSGGGVYLYRAGQPIDDTREYYLNPAQTHSPRGASTDAEEPYERLLFSIYHALLTLAQKELADLRHLCVGTRDVLGLKLDPLVEMRRLGSTGLREAFDRLRYNVGARFESAPLQRIMSTLDTAAAATSSSVDEAQGSH